MTNNKIFVYVNGPHDSHKPLCGLYDIAHKRKIKKYNFFGVFSRLVGFWWQGLFIRGRSFYFFEGSSSAAIAPIVKNRKNLLIIKGNDHLPFLMQQSKAWRFCFQKLIDLNRSVDGMIAVSSMVKEDYHHLFKKLDIIIAEGFMVRDSRELYNIRRAKNRTHHFLSLGANATLKGVDRNIDLFLALKKEEIIPEDTNFYIIGIKSSTTSGLSIDVNEAERLGVRFIAYTRSIAPYLEKASFQLHLARYEPNAVSLMEGMTSGLIPIVSEKTGNKDFIANINPACVVDMSLADELRQKSQLENLKRFLTDLLIKPQQMQSLSDSFRSAEKFYNQKTGLLRWQKAYEYFLQKKKIC